MSQRIREGALQGANRRQREGVVVLGRGRQVAGGAPRQFGRLEGSRSQALRDTRMCAVRPGSCPSATRRQGRRTGVVVERTIA